MAVLTVPANLCRGIEHRTARIESRLSIATICCGAFRDSVSAIADQDHVDTHKLYEVAVFLTLGPPAPKRPTKDP